MSFNYRQNKHYRYYNAQHSNGYTYVNGMGFAPPPPEVTERKQINNLGNRIGITLLLYLVLARLIPHFLLAIFAFFIPAIRIFGGGIVAPPILLLIIDVLTYIIVTLLPFVIYSISYKIPPRVILPNKKISKKLAVAGIGVGLGVSVIGMYSANLLYGFFYVLGKVPTMPDFSLNNNIWSNIFLFLQVVILAPVLEEIVFRGIVMQSMRRFGDTFALIMSSMIFSLIHANFVQSPNAFLMGIVIGYFVLRSGSIKIGIYIHVVNNFLSFAMDILSRYMNEDYFFIVFRTIQAVYVLIGIVALLYILKKYQNFFILNSSETVTKCKQKFVYFLSSVAMILFLIIIIRTMVATVVPY